MMIIIQTYYDIIKKGPGGPGGRAAVHRPVYVYICICICVYIYIYTHC